MIRKHISQPVAEISLTRSLLLDWTHAIHCFTASISVFVLQTIRGVSRTYLFNLVKPYNLFRENMRSANKLLLKRGC